MWGNSLGGYILTLSAVEAICFGGFLGGEMVEIINQENVPVINTWVLVIQLLGYLGWTTSV